MNTTHEPVIFSVVRGDNPTARAVEPDGLIRIPDEVLTWAAKHGLSVDSPDVYLLATPESEAGEVNGEIAYATFRLPVEDAEAIRDALDGDKD